MTEHMRGVAHNAIEMDKSQRPAFPENALDIRTETLNRIVGITLKNEANDNEREMLIEGFNEFVAAPASFRGISRQKLLHSSIRHVNVMDGYKIEYPQVVKDVLGDIYKEYNLAFKSLVGKNAEFGDDYKYTFDKDGNPTNFFVQIDMTGLPEGFLKEVENGSISRRQVEIILRNRIFEVENSLAMYQLLAQVFSRAGETTKFKERFFGLLDKLRKKHGKPIALLAVTEEKYEAMLATEFGLDRDTITPEAVKELTGFDNFFGPEQFRKIVEENGGDSPYMLYTRASLPVSQLKNPNNNGHENILDDDKIRKIVKRNSITYNVDSSSMPYENRINDTKEYQREIGLAMNISSIDDLFTQKFNEFLKNSKPSNKNGITPYGSYEGERLSDEFKNFLIGRGIDHKEVEEGKVKLRGKPMKEAYGCYGHISGFLSDSKFRSELAREMRKRGGYILQDDMPQPEISNYEDGRRFTYIDRVFFGIDPETGDPVFMSGFRSLMPIDTEEAKRGRNHGNSETQWVEIE